jgi:hypothetical protein
VNTLPNQAGKSPRTSTGSSFTPVDSVHRIVSDIIAAGYSAWVISGGFRTDMPDDVYRTFMAQRGFTRDE